MTGERKASAKLAGTPRHDRMYDAGTAGDAHTAGSVFACLSTGGNPGKGCSWAVNEQNNGSLLLIPVFLSAVNSMLRPANPWSVQRIEGVCGSYKAFQTQWLAGCTCSKYGSFCVCWHHATTDGSGW